MATRNPFYRRSWLRLPIVRNLAAMRWRRLRPLGVRPTDSNVMRYYWHEFLTRHAGDVRGHALEVGETTTIRALGRDRLTQADAIDLSPHSPEVKVVADLTTADHVPGDVYDCFLNQFTTAVIYDIESALYHSIRLLKPGGVLLVNFWCKDFYLHRGLDMGTGEPLYMYWWFTPVHVQNLLRGLGLGDGDIEVEVYGNLLSCMACLMNLPADDLTRRELDHADPAYPLLICARVVKPRDWQCTRPPGRKPTWRPPIAPTRDSKETGLYGDQYTRG